MKKLLLILAMIGMVVACGKKEEEKKDDKKEETKKEEKKETAEGDGESGNGIKDEFMKGCKGSLEKEKKFGKDKIDNFCDCAYDKFKEEISKSDDPMGMMNDEKKMEELGMKCASELL